MHDIQIRLAVFKYNVYFFASLSKASPTDSSDCASLALEAALVACISRMAALFISFDASICCSTVASLFSSFTASLANDFKNSPISSLSTLSASLFYLFLSVPGVELDADVDGVEEEEEEDDALTGFPKPPESF